MNKVLLSTLIVPALVLSLAMGAQARPYGPGGFQGRIGLSHDGNFNDEDDWGAFPVMIAILGAFGVKDRLVHIEYNNIIQANDDRFEREMTASVLGAAEKYGIPSAILHNCRTDLDGATESIRDAVNASSRENPFYYVVAGPMDVPYRGILLADPVKRQYVYCISHSSWNDGYGKRRIEGRNKRDLIALGINWIQVGHGGLLAYGGTPGTKSTPAQWAVFHWMRDSADARLRWLFTRLEAEERCDVSDATMGYFLLTGDEKCDPKKLAALLDQKQKPGPVTIRPTIRLEAENFSLLENCVLAAVGRQASQNVTVRLSGTPQGVIRTEFHELYAAPSGRYDIGVQYRDASDGAATYLLRINGKPQGVAWKASTDDNAWKTHTVKDVCLVQSDVIDVEVQADGKDRGELDFVQLTYLGLDDPAALPGQIIVDPGNPQWLKYNGGRRCFLFGTGNPEDFFFFGQRGPDGTRTGGKQSDMIKRLAGTGANTFHVLAMRDSRYNIEPGNGTPDCNPFLDSDISGKLDEDILSQWEGWLGEMEAAGLNVLFNFYNDFDDYEEKAGWKLDAQGNLHPQERYFIETLVTKFKHHKNLIWAVEESCNKLSRAKQQRLKKVAELVAQTDNFHHPIAQMFQILYYDEVTPDKVSPEDYVNDPYVKMMTWGHYSTKAKGLPAVEQYYQELVGHGQEAAGRYVLLNTEVDKHPSTGAINRLYCWTSALANRYTAMSSHRPDKANVPRATYQDSGRLGAFMEGTDFHRMVPRSELKHGSTRYVLANDAGSYIAYTNDATQDMGIGNLPAGTYLLRWFDTVDGDTVEQMVALTAGDQAWPRPASIGPEAALYVKRCLP
ncbi:MAG: hypothetical protein MUC88_18250 [Planctomycetes bacterium]|nr:hypothetical protein [Planctomycetota bacterium]